MKALKVHRQGKRTADLRAEVRALTQALDTADRRAGVVEALEAGRRKPRKLKPLPPVKGKRQAAAVALFSDWHIGERVTKAQTTGANEYTPAIAEKSAHRVADAVAWVIQHHSTSFDLRRVVLWLGGDLITGHLHDDQRESNYLHPTREMLLLQDLIGYAIDRVLSTPGVRDVVIPCSYGNHGRMTAKPRVSTGAETSLEWLIYQQLARTYAGDKRIRFEIASGDFLYLDVLGTRIRFTHGDSTKYAGGVGGVTIPINKSIARWQTYDRADFTCLGHYHQYLDTPGVVINGSLIGPSPYGMRVGSNEPPAQAFFLVDESRGKCQSTPLWVRE